MKREFNFAKNILLSNVKRLKTPYKLTLAVTYACNSRCQICHIWQKELGQELRLKEMEKLFTKNDYFNWIDIVGGEVFLRNDLIPLIRTILISQKNLYFLHIPTNGIMTKIIVKKVKEIIKLNPPRFVISVALDGPRTLHNKLRGISNNWDYAIDTYKQLKELESRRFQVYFGMTLSKYNYLHIEKTYREIKKIFPNFNRSSIHFNIAHNSLNYYENIDVNLGVNNKVFQSLKKYNNKKKLSISPLQWLERSYQSNIPKYIKTNRCPLECRALNSSLFIDPLGYVYPCAMWNEKIGNIRQTDYSIKQLWNTKKTLEILSIIKKRACVQCWTPCEAYQTILGNMFWTISN